MAEYDITAKISGVLKTYSYNITQGINQEAERCADGLKKELRQTSPMLTKDYSKSWQRKKTKTYAGGGAEYTAYNDKNYQLTHLLEHPHAGPYGAGMVRAHPHIGTAEQKWNLDFEESVERVIENA